ncbi:urease subunit gamma [Staphylococcus epidermidis]|uniref:urease subunit gamma n=1 Tax=Staphylococcus epidermidis TaxID=1282 RepID=UPI0037DA2387
MTHQLLQPPRHPKTLPQLITYPKTILNHQHLIHPLPNIITQLQIQPTFPHPTNLITLHHPIL